MVVYDEKFVKKLQHDLVLAKWMQIPEQERMGALRAFRAITWEPEQSKKEFWFIEDYVEVREKEEAQRVIYDLL